MKRVKIIGAGLAGCEAAYFLAKAGIQVDLYEMKPNQFTPAHQNPNFGELVCSNSLKSNTLEFASGLLKQELRELNSFLMKCADASKIDDCNALTVDRETFANLVTIGIKNQPNIIIHNEEISSFSLDEPTIVCAGPLCAEGLSKYLTQILGEQLYFYDAVAPIVSADSIDYNYVVMQDKWHNQDGSYLNCPLTKEMYLNFVNELAQAQRVALHNFEIENNFEGCLPVEIMAKRGKDVLRFACMKGVGINIDGKTPYAVLQLRAENKEHSMYNMVGFQTNLTFSEQKRVFCTIPALKNAEFLRFGVMHRNTFINAPKLLNKSFALKKYPNIFFGGQISGVEGYTESIASGLLCGINMLQYLSNQPEIDFTTETALGALSNYLICGSEFNFQPMHINWGLFKPIDVPKKNKKEAIVKRALHKIQNIKEIIYGTNCNAWDNNSCLP